MMGDLWYNPTRLFFLLKDCYWYASVMYFVQGMHNTKIFYRQQYHLHKHGCKFSNTLCCCFKLFSRIQKNPYENSTIPSRSPFGILWIHVRKAVCNFWILLSYSIDADTSSVKTIAGDQGVPFKWWKTGWRSDRSVVMLDPSESK